MLATLARCWPCPLRPRLRPMGRPLTSRQKPSVLAAGEAPGGRARPRRVGSVALARERGRPLARLGADAPSWTQASSAPTTPSAPLPWPSSRSGSLLLEFAASDPKQPALHPRDWNASVACGLGYRRLRIDARRDARRGGCGRSRRESPASRTRDSVGVPGALPSFAAARRAEEAIALLIGGRGVWTPRRCFPAASVQRAGPDDGGRSRTGGGGAGGGPGGSGGIARGSKRRGRRSAALIGPAAARRPLASCPGPTSVPRDRAGPAR